MHRDRCDGHGFTLLELLVVMVIAGLMLALVPPLFSNTVSGTRLKSCARDLLTVMRETRSRAILYDAEQPLFIDIEGRRFLGANSRAVSIPQGVTITVTPATSKGAPASERRVLRFFPDGGSSGETVTLSSGDYSYHLRLNWLTGQVSLAEGPRDAGA